MSPGALFLVFLSAGCLVVEGIDVCLQDEFSCENGDCVNKTLACDAVYNCKDLTDEKQTCQPLQRHTCPSGWVRCRYCDECVSTDWLCDGTNDCSDHSDEVPCQDASPPDYTWNDVSIHQDPARLSLVKLNETFDDFGQYVGKKLRAVGVRRALLLERLINELLFLGQLGFVDEDGFFCNKKGKPLF